MIRLLPLLICAALPAFAETDCDRPMADWRPAAELLAKVAAMGWTVERMRADDGCYLLRATEPDGQRVEMLFDPVTLTPVGVEEEEHHHDHEKWADHD